MIISTTHISGPTITINGRVIQRCAVCGEKLLDNLHTMVPVGPDGVSPAFATWPPGRLVQYAGDSPRRETLLPDSEQLPGDSCIDLVEW